jgi:hypothetical protein
MKGERISKVRFFQCALLAVFVLPALAQGQRLQGIASVTTENQVFTVQWEYYEGENVLKLYRGLQVSEGTLVDTYKERDFSWTSVSSIPEGANRGFQVRTEVPEGWYGPLKVFLIVRGRLVKAYQSTEDAVVTDLDGDGHPEIVEFLNGRDAASPRTRILAVRANTKFEAVVTTTANHLYSQFVKRKLSAFRQQNYR